MEIHERRFLTTSDRRYLDEVELTLARVYRIPPERAGAVVRALGRDLQRMRARGDQTPPGVQFPYGGAAGHAEALAALIVAPRPPSPVFLGILALMGAAAGLLGMRVLLAIIFRDFAPVRIGWLDIALAVVAIGVILGAAQSAWLLKRLGPLPWLASSLALGITIGLGATALLRALHMQRTLVNLPLWLAAIIAAVCGALTWLLTWPGDDLVYPTDD
ncbi:MAG: hypothetical protein M3Y58_04530 [Chloroflexota bacterium]|nr:hypothetical protein [Chloroflexota bacterium]